MPVKVLLFNFLLRIRDRVMLITSASVFPNNRDMMNISTVPVSWMVVIFPQEHRSNTLSVIW